jgi:hypothetical protein
VSIYRSSLALRGLADGLLLATLALSLGCRETTDRVAVEGLVTLDGQPLTGACILFIPCGGNRGPKAGGAVEQGKFNIVASDGPPPGELRVEILPLGAPQTIGVIRQPGPAIPQRYNVRSELMAQATFDGPNRFEFRLYSRPARKPRVPVDDFP